jgi:OOP family OmpA-OmpF porin
MKNLKLIALLFLFAGVVQAQTSDNPWLISAGINGISLQSDFTGGANALTKSNYKSMSLGVPSLSVFRTVYGGLSLGAQFSLNNIKSESGLNDAKFSSIDFALKYGFSRDSKLSPYLKAGVARASIDIIDQSSFNAASSATDTYFGGAGISYKLGDNLSAFVETSYRSSQDNPKGNFLQHSAGLSYGLGSGDADKDGISDKKDKCPDVPGLKEFEGCPDTDADGIPDNLDGCPEEAGPEENNGCPDTDGDGVLDKDDTCPDVSGLVELNGCPDTDEDGIMDSEDECPEEAGDLENKGCPWPDTDNDGVADKDDACPKEAGTAEGNGCPDTPKDILDKMNGIGSNILFAAESSKLMGKKVFAAIGEIKRVLDENPSAKILIEGHASSDGSAEYNDALSLKRAEVVQAKLIELGADSNRIEVKAYGETMPIDVDDSPQARTKNRRVEFKALTEN